MTESLRYLQMLSGDERAGFLEIRWTPLSLFSGAPVDHYLCREFIPITESAAAAEMIERFGRRTDVRVCI